jgi:hypothetical protein
MVLKGADTVASGLRGRQCASAEDLLSFPATFLRRLFQKVTTCDALSRVYDDMRKIYGIQNSSGHAALACSFESVDDNVGRC